MGGHEEPGSESRFVDRRRFTVEMALALLGGATITIGCGGGGSPAGPGPITPVPTPTPTSSDDEVGAVAQNHGHEAIITGAQLRAGSALRLDIHGVAIHGHIVDLSAEEIAQIRAGERVEKTSTVDIGLLGPHSHSVTFN